MSAVHSAATADHPPAARNPLAEAVPGIGLVVVIALATAGLRQFEPLALFSPVILAILLGMAVTNIIGLPKDSAAGIGFCGKTLLRSALMLLGAQITLSDLLALGPLGVVAIVAVIAVTLPLTFWIGRKLGLERDMAALIAAGSAICGASAIAGMNSVLRGRDETVAYAVGIVTIFGTIGIFLLPVLSDLAGFVPHQYGIWVGLSLHEVAQVVAAGFAEGDAAGKVAVSVKLGRVLMLAAVVAVVARWLLGPRDAGEQASGTEKPRLMPWYLLGFLLLACVNSAGLLPPLVVQLMMKATAVMMMMAMAALGLGADMRKLMQLGLRPLVLGLIATVIVTATGFAFALMMG